MNRGGGEMFRGFRGQGRRAASGYRGGGNRNRGRGSDGQESSWHSRGAHSQSRGGRPPGLRGKDIGMFYARRSKEQKMLNRSSMTLSKDQLSKIEEEITHLRRLDPFPTKSTDRNSEFWEKFSANKLQNFFSDSGFLTDVDRDGSDSSSMVMDEEIGIQTTKHSLQLRKQLEEKAKSSPYQNMLKFREKLPAYKMKQEIVDIVNKNQAVVISGETGCGKTTQVPQLILDDLMMRDRGAECRIVCTQPRRISAISIAERVAEERNEKCGGPNSSVGYQIRLENKLPRSKGCVLYCTTGVVMQWMRSDPLLKTVSHIVLDEIHERDILSDFLITLLKDVLVKRPDLKIILMSATLNSELFSKYFNNCPMINIPGFTYPVEEYYLEDALEMTGFQIDKDRSKPRFEPKWKKHAFKKKLSCEEDSFEDFINPFLRQLRDEKKYSEQTLESLSSPKSEEVNHDLIARLALHIHHTKNPGAVLVFVPGWDDISKVHKILNEELSESCARIYPLHSLMPSVNQKEIFERPPKGVRKIVIATNIAETSITIEDVVYVIDCGKIKVKDFDTNLDLTTLKPTWVSLANARQRRGRAGRVQPGICYHLYTRAREMTLQQFMPPEFVRTPLEEVVLQIKILGLGRAESFLMKLIEPPSENALKLALANLHTINAVDKEEHLTPLGFHLAHLPMDPYVGKMILMGAIFCCLDPVLSIAASLAFKDPFVTPLGKEQLVDQIRLDFSRGTRSDHLMIANVVSEWERARAAGKSERFCWDNFISSSTMNMLAKLKSDMAGHLKKLKFISSLDVKASLANQNSHNEDLVRAIICSGLYPRVASVKIKRTGKGGAIPLLKTRTDKRAGIHPKSVNSKQGKFENPWLVYHLKMKSTSVNIYDCSEVSPMALLFFGEDLKVGNDTLPDGRIVETISVDDFVTFNCSRDASKVFKTLRRGLQELLEFKAENPGITKWNLDELEGATLRTIIDLFSCKPTGSSHILNDDDDDDGDNEEEGE